MKNEFIKEIQITKTIFDKDKIKEGDMVLYKHRKGYYLNKELELWDEELECEIYKIEDEDLYLKHMGDIMSLSIADLENTYFYELELLKNK